MTVLSFNVMGLPAPQGSKRHVGHGVMIESSKKVAPWREAVKWAAIKQCGSMEPLDGPLAMRVVFTLPKPKSARKGRWCPDRMPDLSKLVRSTEDALTDAGLWVDDARLVEVHARKVWPGHDKYALPAPGARIQVWTLEDVS